MPAAAIAKAYEIARSGAAEDCSQIEALLTLEGFSDADLILAPADLRAELDEICLKAREGRGDWNRRPPLHGPEPYPPNILVGDIGARSAASPSGGLLK